MGHNDFADVLKEDLEEEKGADAKLNKIAEDRVNAKANGKASTRHGRSNRAPRRHAREFCACRPGVPQRAT
jgi:hypothetical protein